MAELTQTEIEAKLTAIDAQLDTLIASPDRAMDFSIGPLSFSLSQKVSGLVKLREHYQGLLNAIPSETYARIAVDIDDLGIDQTDYLGDTGE
jgi:hypothetical protein